MTSFSAVARRVRDIDLAWRERVLGLRECVLCFAPYGFRATWHHLLVRGEDPPSLCSALEELEEARLLWRARSEDYAARRRRQKAAGNRMARRVDPWHSMPWFLAYCPDFAKHPTERLAVVVQRVITAYESGVDLSATCRVCGQALAEGIACPTCGVSPPARRHHSRADTVRWQEVWQRTRYR